MINEKPNASGRNLFLRVFSFFSPGRFPKIAVPLQTKSAAQRYTYLDGWRGFAIVLVLDAHFFNLIPLNTGRLGVDMFFCLSGFLMSGILFIQNQPLSTFYKRRISRIAPVFFTFVLAAYALAGIQGRAFLPAEFISTLLFLRTYLPEYPGIWEAEIPVGHLWSLNIEEHCYVLMSLLVMLRAFRGREGLVLLSFGTGCIGIGFLYVKLGDLAPNWGVLGTEVAASHLLISAGYRLILERYSWKVSPFVPILSLIAAIFCYSKLMPWWSASLFSPFLFAFTVNHLSQTYDDFKLFLSSPLLKQLGIWSFSIYLWQQPFYAYKTSFPGSSMAALASAMVIALVSFYAVERPSRAWLNKNW